jgi:hypothetical protein
LSSKQRISSVENPGRGERHLAGLTRIFLSHAQTWRLRRCPHGDASVGEPARVAQRSHAPPAADQV